MLNNGSKLLKKALLYENGHAERTKHILMVHSLARTIGSEESLTMRQQQIVEGAAILCNIAVKRSKRKSRGSSLKSQQTSAKKILLECSYVPSYIEHISELLLYHNDHSVYRGLEHQILIEADIIASCLEAEFPKERAMQAACCFRTQTGKELLNRLFDSEEQNDIV